MKIFNRQVGKKGEKTAEDFLRSKGLEIIERNYSTRFGEIDLICRDNKVLVFVEVKTKKGRGFGTPEEMFNRGKYERVKRMATIYLQGKEVPCRIDMIAVYLSENDEVVEIRHYKNVVNS